MNRKGNAETKPATVKVRRQQVFKVQPVQKLLTPCQLRRLKTLMVLESGWGALCCEYFCPGLGKN